MNYIRHTSSPLNTTAVFSVVFLASHSGCNVCITETLQSALCSSGFKAKKITHRPPEGWGRVCDRRQRVRVICVSECIVGFTANPTGGAGLVGGGRGFLGLVDSL